MRKQIFTIVAQDGYKKKSMRIVWEYFPGNPKLKFKIITR